MEEGIDLSHIYATKFLIEVRETDFGEVKGILEEKLLPELSSRGYMESVCIATKRTLDRLDKAKAKGSLAKLSEKMVAVSQVRDEKLAGDLATLRYGLVEGVTGYAHGMIHHNKKSKRPREYELLRRESLRERNREMTSGFQLDIYASHSGGTPVAPAFLELITSEYLGRLFGDPKAIEYTVFQRMLDNPGAYALRVIVAAPSGRRSEDPREVKAKIRSLTETLMERRGAAGILSLKSFGEGYARAARWHPNGIAQHRGYAIGSDPEITGFSDIYELVTLWKTEADRVAASEWLKGKLSSLTGNMEGGHGGFAVGNGDRLFRKGNI